MYAVSISIFFENFIYTFIYKNLRKKLIAFLFTFFSFFFQYYSVSHAMQPEDRLEDRQNIKKLVVQSRKEDLNTDSHEKETTPLLPFIEKEKNLSWRKSWIVQNVIVDFPIIGDFFHDDLSALGAIKKAGKSTCMLLGGSVGMMLDFISTSENDDMAIKVTKASINMAVGMWAAVTIYNTVLSLGYIGYNYIKSE